MSASPPPTGDDARRDALAGRLFEATLGAFDLLAVHLGMDLGLYAALRAGGPATAAELARRAGIHARYAREWLEHQAVTGILDVVGPSDDADARRYGLPAAHAGVLLDPDDLSTMAPMPLFVSAAVRTWPALLEAYRTGDGVDWTDYPRLSEAQELANRPLFQRLLTQEWLPAIPDVHEKLLTDGARVVDIAAGSGWSSIAMGRAYPGIRWTAWTSTPRRGPRDGERRGRRAGRPGALPRRRRRPASPGRTLRPGHHLRGGP